MDTSNISIAKNFSSPLGNEDPPTSSDLLASHRTLPAKPPLSTPASPQISVENLFDRSFILKEGQMERLRDREPITMKTVELARIQDHSTRDDSMALVFVFRVFPKSTARRIQERADSSGQIAKEDLRSLSLFEGVKVRWEDSAPTNSPYYSSMREGMQTLAPVKYKKVDGEERLLVQSFMPVLTKSQVEDRYVCLNGAEMKLLRGSPLRIDEMEVADRRMRTVARSSESVTHTSSELVLIFRVMPEETRNTLFQPGADQMKWLHVDPSRPLNAVFSLDKSKCPDELLDLRRGDKVSGVIDYYNPEQINYPDTGKGGDIRARDIEPIDASDPDPSSSSPESPESNEHFKHPPPDASTNPGTSSPQKNDEWYNIDGRNIHRDQL